MQVVPDGIRCECGNRGCWEQYASRQRPRARGPRADRGRVARRGPTCSTGSAGDADGLTGPARHRGRPRGRPAGASSCSRTSARWLGIGMADLAAAFDPGLVRHRRRGQRRRRAAARPGPRGVPAPAAPAAATGPRPRIVAGPARQRGRPRRRRRPGPRRPLIGARARPRPVLRVVTLQHPRPARRPPRPPPGWCARSTPTCCACRRCRAGSRPSSRLPPFARACGLRLAPWPSRHRRHGGPDRAEGASSATCTGVGSRSASPTGRGGMPPRPSRSRATAPACLPSPSSACTSACGRLNGCATHRWCSREQNTN